MKQLGSIALIGLGLVLAACSGESPELAPEEQGVAICFSGQQAEEQSVTRAVTRTSLKDADVSSFMVWGYKDMSYTAGAYSDLQTVMRAFEVQWQSATSTTNTDGWEYILPDRPTQTIKYWDYSAAAYRFFGVAPYGSYTTTLSGDDYLVSINADANDEDDKPYYSRLWFSTGSLVDYPTRQFGRPVQLEFMRPLARVRFLFVSADEDVPLSDLNLEGYDFRPLDTERHIAKRGTFTVSYPLTGTATTESWTTTPGTASADYKSAMDTPWTTTNDYWENVLPITDQGAYRLTVSVLGEEKTADVPSSFMNWQPGYQYTYVFKVSGELGVELGDVNAAYTEWQPGRDANHQIYNW